MSSQKFNRQPHAANAADLNEKWLELVKEAQNSSVTKKQFEAFLEGHRKKKLL